MKVMSKKRVGRPRKVRQQKEKTVASVGNPFEITTDVPLSSTHGQLSGYTEMLLESISKLPIDKNVSVHIPKTIVPSKKETAALVSAVRRVISLNKTKYGKDFTITIRTEMDNNKMYNGSRIWRIA